MELNWSTFILEIINFLVLVWILKRFLYKPILNVIAQRRATIEKQTLEAQQLREKAEALKKQYQSRLSDWEQERQQARDNLTQELDQERARQTDALQTTLTQEREKMQIAEERRRGEKVREIEHQALQQGAEFATRLLASASGPELEQRLISHLQEEIESLSPRQIGMIKEHWGAQPEQVKLCSAYPLSDRQKQQLEKSLTSIIGESIPIVFSETPALLAGLHITIGAWVLQANVRDDLIGFAEFSHATR